MSGFDDEQAYEDDLAAQNAVEDAKHDFPPQEEPAFDDGPTTHHELAEDLLQASDFAKNEAWSQIKATQAVARALLAVADPLAAFAGIEQRLGELRVQLADHLRATERSWQRVEDALDVLGTPQSEPVDPNAVRVGSVSSTDPAELGGWLRGLPERSALRDRAGDVWVRGHVGGFADGIWDSPALLFPGTTVARRLAEGHVDVGGLTNHAPFTVLALGTAQDGA